MAELGIFFVGVFIIRALIKALLFGVHIGPPEYSKLPGSGSGNQEARGNCAVRAGPSPSRATWGC